MTPENLIPLSERTKEEQRAICSAGGRASGEARRKKKALKNQMLMLLGLPVTDKRTWDKMSQFGIPVDDIDNNTRLVYSLLMRAFTGDVAAIKEVRSLIGEDSSADVLIKLDAVLESIDYMAEDEE